MTAGFCVFLIFIHTVPTVWNNLEIPCFHGEKKSAYCENVYKRLGSPAIFKISPVVSPDFDYTLENRGYEIQHTTEVMTMALSDAHIDTHYQDVMLTDEIPDILDQQPF